MTVIKLLPPLNTKKTTMPSVIGLMVLILIDLISSAHADSERYIDYNYDGAGNIISVRSARNIEPPDVTNLSPAFIHKESIAFITAMGTNLAKVKASINQPGVSLIDVINISETEVKLAFVTDETAQIGLVPITFSTRLGSDIENLAVAERTPVISTNPSPIVLSPDHQTVIVKLTFDKPFTSNQIFDVKVTDQSIANLAIQQINLIAGQTEVSTSIIGLVSGSTTLQVNQLSNFLALSIPVIVINQDFPLGNSTEYSDPVGVLVFTDELVSSNKSFALFSKVVGITTLMDQAINSNMPLFSSDVGVSALIDQAINTNKLFFSNDVGVTSYMDQAVTGYFLSDTIGSSFGTDIDSVNPQLITAPSNITLTIKGVGLDAVSAISFNPNDGISLTEPLNISADGQQINLSIAVTETASTGNRSIILTTPEGDQTSSNGVFEISN